MDKIQRVSDFNTDVKKYIPKKTLVIMVPEKDIERLKLLLDAPDDLPEPLASFLNNVKRQLG